MFFFPPLPIIDSHYELACLALISFIFLISLLSLYFIFYLRLKSTQSHHLHHFNSLWTVRFLLVFFISLWALNEFITLPLLHHSLTLSRQTNLCKIHVVLSLGLSEPGFLITLLFLVNISTRKRNPRDLWAIFFIFLTCFPILALQALFLYFPPLQLQLPEIFQRDFVLSRDKLGNVIVICAYPLINSVLFGAFGIAYTFVFILSCWRVLSLVINKGIRIRIRVLALAASIMVPAQVVLLGLSSLLWQPETTGAGVTVGMCFTMAVCAVVGEGILVIKPISDALAVGEDCDRYGDGDSVRLEVDRRETLEGSQ